MKRILALLICCATISCTCIKVQALEEPDTSPAKSQYNKNDDSDSGHRVQSNAGGKVYRVSGGASLYKHDEFDAFGSG